MAIPVIYNLAQREARVGFLPSSPCWESPARWAFSSRCFRWRNGFRATLVASGSQDNAMLMRAGATAEMMGAVTLDEHARSSKMSREWRATPAGPLVTPEAVVVAPFPLGSTGTNANVQVRGVSPECADDSPQCEDHRGANVSAGPFRTGCRPNANKTYSGLTVGNTVDFGGGHWKVVGVFDAGGSAFDSEVWADARVLEPGVQAAGESLSVGHRAPDFSRGIQSIQGFGDRRPATECRSDPRSGLLREAIHGDDDA